MRPNTPAATVGATVVIVLLVGLAFATMGQPGALPGSSASAVPSATIAVSSASASPSVSPSITAGPSASGTASPVASGTTSSATPTPAPTPTPTVTPTLTVKPTATPTPTKPASGSFVFVSVRGRDISGQDTSGGGTVTVVDESIVVTSTGGADQTSVTYEIPPDDLPSGVTFDRLDVRVCGVPSGDAWEIDGPSGSTPDTWTTEPPASDGCWHFARGNAKSSALLVAVSGDSEIRVDRVIYRLRVK